MSLTEKKQHLQRRKNKIRAKVSGSADRPRLSVFKSNTAIYAQLIDDIDSKVLVSASSMKEKTSSNIESAKKVGLEIAKLAKSKKITSCIFDRGGNVYHGRVKALAEGAREGGLQF